MLLNFFRVMKYSLLSNNPERDDKILQTPSRRGASLKVVFFTAEVRYAEILPAGLIKSGKHGECQLCHIRVLLLLTYPMCISASIKSIKDHITSR